MKQYRITTDNLNQDSDEDCVLDANDPINEIKTIKYLAGLGASAKLHEYRVDKGELMKKNNIKPGTPEWFQLWFSLPYMTGEKPVGKK